MNMIDCAMPCTVTARRWRQSANGANLSIVLRAASAFMSVQSPGGERGPSGLKGVKTP